jgi:hypothetical protein
MTAQEIDAEKTKHIALTQELAELTSVLMEATLTMQSTVSQQNMVCTLRWGDLSEVFMLSLDVDRNWILSSSMPRRTKMNYSHKRKRLAALQLLLAE